MNQASPEPQPGNQRSAKGETKTVSVRMAVVLCAGLLALWSTEILDAGFYHDDSVTSNFASEASLGGQDAWSYSAEHFQSLVRFQGRCSLAYAFGITPFLVLIGDNLDLYRAWHLAWTAMALVAFAWSVRRITGDWIVAAFAAAVALSFFCTNNFHSSLVSYGVILQQMAVFGFLGLGLAYINTENHPRQRVHLAASVFCVALAILTTEFGLVYVPLVALAFCLQKGLRKGAWLAAPYIAIALIYALTTVLVKQPGQYEGAAFGTMESSLIITTWLKQLSGTLPFTFPFTPEGNATLGQHWFPRIITTPWFWLFFAFALLAFHWLAKHLSYQKLKTCLVLGIFGLVLIVLPAGLTSISAKYQKALFYGVPYVQVFMQYMGLALVLTGFWLWLQQCLKTRLRVRTLAHLAFAIALAFTYASTLELNRITVQQLNRIWHFPRHNLGDALSLLELRPGQTPLFVIDRAWLQRWEWTPFAFHHSGHRADFITLSDFIKKTGENFPGQPAIDAYFIRYPVRSDQDADVYIARIAALNRTPGGVEMQFAPGEARLVRFGPDLESVTGAELVCDTAVGLSDTPLPLTSKEIRPGRVATIWRASDQSLHVP